MAFDREKLDVYHFALNFLVIARGKALLDRIAAMLVGLAKRRAER